MSEETEKTEETFQAGIFLMTVDENQSLTKFELTPNVFQKATWRGTTAITSENNQHGF